MGILGDLRVKRLGKMDLLAKRERLLLAQKVGISRNEVRQKENKQKKEIIPNGKEERKET